MTAEIPVDAQLNWGTRRVVIFKLDPGGKIAAADSSGYMTGNRYDGVQIVGATAFQMQEPSPRTVDFPGDDGIIAQDSMPALQGETAEITASPWDFELVALMENTKIHSSAGRRRLARGTNKAGTEPRFGVMLYQQSLGLDTGDRKWHTIIYPSAKITPMGSGGADSPQQTRYQVVPTKVSKHLWGAAMTVAEDGATSQRKVELEGYGRPVLTHLYPDGTTLTFELNDDHPIASADTTEIWLNGSLMANGYTVSVANNNIVFDAAHLLTDEIEVLYEELDNE